MAAGVTFKHKRKAGAFSNGELQAGELGLDVTNSVWYFSINGTTVTNIQTGAGSVDTANSPNANEFARFTDADTIEGRTVSETKSDLSLDNVTNESKATMFTNAALTGTPTAPTPSAADSSTKIATTAFVAGEIATASLGIINRTTVRAATTADITISTALNNGDSLDGVTLATNDLVLVKNQSAGEQNGIYVVGAVPARSTQFDTYNEHVGAQIIVQEGTANADTIWFSTSNAGGTLNTTAIAFSKLVIAGELLAANNLSDVANAGTARSNLGLAIGSQVQAWDATLDALAAQDWAANSLAIGSGANTVAQVTFAANKFPARASTGNLVAKDITDFALTILDDSNGAAVLSTIGAAATSHTHAATDITSGDLATARMQTNVAAALNATGSATVNTSSLTIDGGTI